jgi:hypothetical protein
MRCYNDWMKIEDAEQSAEKLFGFVKRARVLIVGRDILARSKSRLHFILITRDISENSRKAILADFRHYPVVQHYTSDDLERFFGIKGTRVIGFGKSGLAKSIYAALKEYRIPASVPGAIPNEPAADNEMENEPDKEPTEISPKKPRSRKRIRIDRR